MAEPLTLYKLIILYMLKKVAFPLTNAQISEFVLDQEYTTYFTLQQAISELTRGKTIITIAHRLATIQNADQILVVADGRIAEHGSPKELIEKDGIFAAMSRLQTEGQKWTMA